jgi:hypothetical protein
VQQAKSYKTYKGGHPILALRQDAPQIHHLSKGLGIEEMFKDLSKGAHLNRPSQH